MYQRLLTFLRCPACQGALEFEAFPPGPAGDTRDISEGLLHCPHDHWFPVVGGIPRMLPDALKEHWHAIEDHLETSTSPVVRRLLAQVRSVPNGRASYDQRTRENFSLEWEHHDLGGRTWGMDLDDRVRWFFLEPIRMEEDQLDGKVMLDGGCGNGSQSVAYSRFGLEVIALDLSSGLEHGHALRHSLPGAVPEKVHFVQGDLQAPPFAPSQFDLVHTAGVIHHTSDTLRTFRQLAPLVRPGGTYYVWVYRREPVVTPVVNSLRAVTTRIPPARFSRVATLAAPAFQVFCRTLNALGIRAYPNLSRRDAALALMDIFGAPYAHSHTVEEVKGWFESEGFAEAWSCNEDRRGFGVCGRRSEATAHAHAAGAAMTTSNGPQAGQL
ncbi:MAG: class I SAM-dependent methyltransferase [Actinomycetota bacterium]|nr:class I SAM-dependent methyltransferase [Actinomycetota bacterium]